MHVERDETDDSLLYGKVEFLTVSASACGVWFLQYSCLTINLIANRDAVLYALGVGACAKDAMDVDELKYVYHENGQKFVQVLFICPGY